MSLSKYKTTSAQCLPVTCGGAAILAGKLAKMAAAASNASGTLGFNKDAPGTLSMSQLVTELEKHRTFLREDMSTLIQNSVKPARHLTAEESLAGENFERLTTETTVKLLQAQNKLLQDLLMTLKSGLVELTSV